MAVILAFTILGSVLFVGAYYLLVKRYYWGTEGGKEKPQEDQAKEVTRRKR